MHVYQMRSSIPSVVSATQERMQICMDALKEVSKVWLVAKMVHTLFLSILGNKVLEERLQKAAGKRHKKPRLDSQQPQTSAESPPKSKFDDMSLQYPSGQPAPQVSFERSRPQTPAVTPSREISHAHSSSMTAPSTISPNMRQTHEAFLATGSSRNNTRPPTPFNAYSIPATPPDLYLVTRNSPTISQSLWENFQPDQLFPESTNMNFTSPYGNSINQQNLDPALQMPTMQTPTMANLNLQNQQQQMQQGQMQGIQMSGLAQDQSWTNQLSPEDSWSNSSRGGPAVPTTLNVEDW